MTTFHSFFLTQDRSDLLYKKSFFSLLSFYAKKCAHGWDAKTAWSAAWEWGVTSLSLNESELNQLNDLVSILSTGQEVKVNYLDKGEKKAAVLRWDSKEKYPFVS